MLYLYALYVRECVVLVCLFCHAMLVSSVQPVAVHSSMFCTVYSSCSFVMLVVDKKGDHMVEAYSSIGLVVI